MDELRWTATGHTAADEPRYDYAEAPHLSGARLADVAALVPLGAQVTFELLGAVEITGTVVELTPAGVTIRVGTSRMFLSWQALHPLDVPPPPPTIAELVGPLPPITIPGWMLGKPADPAGVAALRHAGYAPDPGYPPIPANLPDGHPLTWEQLAPYEREQGGYWFYPPDKVDLFGNGKVWVPVTPPVDEPRPTS